MLKKACAKESEIVNFLSGRTYGGYKLPRDDNYEETFIRWLRAAGFDDDGAWLDTHLIPFTGEHNKFENDVFMLMPYYWGDDEKVLEQPNFRYKPEDIQIFWYKHPFRDATISKNMSPDAFRAMLGACLDSVRASIASVSRGRSSGAR